MTADILNFPGLPREQAQLEFNIATVDAAVAALEARSG
jgi:hypothetical protein